MGEDQLAKSPMQPTTPGTLFYTGLERLFGSQALKDGIKPIADHPGSSFTTLCQWLLTVTDASGADGVSLVAGKEAFDLLLRDHGEEMGLQDTAFRMQPLRKRAQQGLERLAAWFDAEWGWQSSVTSQNETLNFHLGTTNVLHEGVSRSPFCYFVEGLIQGLLLWVSGGRFFEGLKGPTSTDAQACCEISFSRTPLD